jgi:hypothetical protein
MLEMAILTLTLDLLDGWYTHHKYQVLYAAIDTMHPRKTLLLTQKRQRTLSYY